jgi:hypothetical protein
MDKSDARFKNALRRESLRPKKKLSDPIGPEWAPNADSPPEIEELDLRFTSYSQDFRLTAKYFAFIALLRKKDVFFTALADHYGYRSPNERKVAPSRHNVALLQ